MTRGQGAGAHQKRWPGRAPLRAVCAALAAAAAAMSLTGSAPAAQAAPETPRRAAAVERPTAPAADALLEDALKEALALATAALDDAAATARVAPEAAAPDLLQAMDDATARLVALQTPGARGPVSPPPGEPVGAWEIEAAAGDVFRAAAQVRAADDRTAASTVAVGWTAPATLDELEAHVAAAEEAAARLDAMELRPRGWVERDHPAVEEAELCPIPFAPAERLRCDAAAALAALNSAYRAEHGTDLAVSSAFRTYAEQVALRASLGGLAARPGTSNHEKAVAVDLAGVGALGDFSSPLFGWLAANAPRFGWAHPPALGPDGSGPAEPWHWEYVG